MPQAFVAECVPKPLWCLPRLQSGPPRQQKHNTEAQQVACNEKTASQAPLMPLMPHTRVRSITMRAHRQHARIHTHERTHP